MRTSSVIAKSCIVLSVLGGMTAFDSAQAQNEYLLGWGMNADKQASPVPTNVMEGVEAISAGALHSLGLKAGRVWAWGFNGNQQTNVPVAAQSNVDQVAAGGIFSLALKTDGSVVSWGAPVITTNMPAETASGVSAIAAGEWHALALKSGAVIAWGSNTHGQCDVPVELTTGVEAISAGGHYSMALKGGAVHVFGIAETNTLEYGIRAVPPEASNDVTAISAGKWHALALRDGGVIAWGGSYDGTNSFSDATNVPPEATSDVVAISAGDVFNMALKTDGTIVMWGDELKGQYPVPDHAATGITQIAAGGGHALAVCPVLPPRFTGSSLPFGYIGFPYEGSVTASADPAAAYTTFGAFPGWMNLDSGTGEITGTPPTNTTYNFTLVASNTYGVVTGAYSVTVFATLPQPPVFVTESPLPDGMVGAPYSLQIVVSNNPVLSVVGGSGSGLPPGMTLSTNGLLSGTPTEAYNSFFEVRATNNVGSSNRIYSITISLPEAPPVFVTESPLPSGLVGEPYSLQIVASNAPVFSLFDGDLPDGLTLDAAGLVSGTPTQIDSAVVTVRATNVVGASNRVYEIEINGPPVFVTGSPLPDANVDQPYSLQIEADGDPLFSLESGSLPAGLDLSVGGFVSGTPTTPGLSSFTVRATNDYGWTNRTYDLSTLQLPVITTTNPLPDGKVGDPYAQTIEATGGATFSVVGGSVPDGLGLAAGGLLSGTPTAAGAAVFTVRATNEYGFSDQEFDLNITDYQPPVFLSIRATNTNVYLQWDNPNSGVDIRVWRSTNILMDPVPWVDQGVQLSPWTNTGAPTPAYYHLRLDP